MHILLVGLLLLLGCTLGYKQRGAPNSEIDVKRGPAAPPPFDPAKYLAEKKAQLDDSIAKRCEEHEGFANKATCVAAWQAGSKIDPQGVSYAVARKGVFPQPVLCLTSLVTKVFESQEVCWWALEHPDEYKCKKETGSDKSASYYGCVNYLEAKEWREQQARRMQEQQDAIDEMARQPRPKPAEAPVYNPNDDGLSQSIDSLNAQMRLDDLERQQRIMNCQQQNAGNRVNAVCQ